MAEPVAEHHHGQCHCGAITVDLALSKPAGAQQVRSCQCGFCRRQGSRTIADPGGQAVVRAATPDTVLRYRFGLKSADFLVCRQCGTYVAAVMGEAGRSVSVVNVGGLDIAAFRGRVGDTVTYDGEDVSQRLARRKTYWMPIELRLDGSPTAAPPA